VGANPKFAHLLRKGQYKVQRMKGKDMSRYFKLTADYLQQHGNPPLARYGNQKERLAKIGNVKLAKSSWGWGIRNLGAAAGKTNREIPNVTETAALTSGRGLFGIPNGFGHEMTNALSYLAEILPAGWERTATFNAIKVMRHNMETKIGHEMGWEMEMVGKS
jgi:hypothetical protein